MKKETIIHYAINKGIKVLPSYYTSEQFIEVFDELLKRNVLSQKKVSIKRLSKTAKKELIKQRVAERNEIIRNKLLNKFTGGL